MCTRSKAAVARALIPNCPCGTSAAGGCSEGSALHHLAATGAIPAGRVVTRHHHLGGGGRSFHDPADGCSRRIAACRTFGTTGQNLGCHAGLEPQCGYRSSGAMADAWRLMAGLAAPGVAGGPWARWLSRTPVGAAGDSGLYGAPPVLLSGASAGRFSCRTASICRSRRSIFSRP